MNKNYIILMILYYVDLFNKEQFIKNVTKGISLFQNTFQTLESYYSITTFVFVIMNVSNSTYVLTLTFNFNICLENHLCSPQRRRTKHRIKNVIYNV